MYGGPKGLGDPNYRELSKMEEDPLIPQRMRDITRTQLCMLEVEKYPGFWNNRSFPCLEATYLYAIKNLWFLMA